MWRKKLHYFQVNAGVMRLGRQRLTAELFFDHGYIQNYHLGFF